MMERPGYVSGRAALRILVAHLVACTAAAVVFLGLSLPARSFVVSWSVFQSNWGLAFIVALLVQANRSRRRGSETQPPRVPRG
jgi:hypothetical protein